MGSKKPVNTEESKDKAKIDEIIQQEAAALSSQASTQQQGQKRKAVGKQTQLGFVSTVAKEQAVKKAARETAPRLALGKAGETL
jgi:hypothetical protein